jgi:NAD(P)-dependent dehydrogenase (short-subunit alcohol dehydrogenase family)
MVVLITALTKDFDKKLAAVFIRQGHKVFAIGNEKIDGVTLLPPEKAIPSSSIDIYIDVTDERSEFDNFTIRDGINENVIRDLYEVNVIRPMAMLETFLPLLETGEGKRLCWLTSTSASINETHDTDGYGYKMAKAGLHNFLQITRNVLAPRGYTFRVYDPCLTSQSVPASARAAYNYFIRRRGIERGDPQRDDEGNLVFRDAFGRQHTW